MYATECSSSAKDESSEEGFEVIDSQDLQISTKSDEDVQADQMVPSSEAFETVEPSDVSNAGPSEVVKNDSVDSRLHHLDGRSGSLVGPRHW